MPTPIPYIAFMLVSAGFAVVTAVAALRRRGPHSRSLGHLMIAVAIWSFALAGEATATSIPGKILWSKIQYIGVVPSSFFLLLFTLAFTDRRQLLRHPLPALYAAIPMVTLLLAWTNEWHGLIWADYVRLPPPQDWMIDYEHGAWFWLHIGYTYTLISLSSVLLLREAFVRRAIFRWQAAALLVAIVPPFVFSFIYATGWGPFPDYDLTPTGFVFTGIVLLTGFTRHGVLDFVPLARERVISHMQDGLLVVDSQGRVVDANPAMYRLLGYLAPGAGLNRDTRRVIGTAATTVLANWPALQDCLALDCEDLVEIDVAGHGHYEVAIGELPEERDARIILVRDVTEPHTLRTEAAEHARQEAVLQAVVQTEQDLQTTADQVLRYVHAEVEAAMALLRSGELEAANSELAEMNAALSDATVDVRVLAESVHTLPHYERDFFAALSAYAHNFSQSTDLRITLSLPEATLGTTIDPLISLQLLRTIHAALTNVRHHANVEETHVIMSCLGPWLQIVVADEGSGFNPDKVEIAHPEGGLVAMHNRMQTIGGALEVRSTPGDGTQIVLQVPLPDDEAPRGPLLPPIRVMLVDDHPLILEGFADLLLHRGAQIVGTANNGREAVTLAVDLSPDLILMDIQMPELTGIEATLRIKQQLPTTKIVMLTASRNGDDLVAAIRAGADGYLVKHLDVDEFITHLTKIARDEVPIAPGLTEPLLRALVRMDVPEPRIADAIALGQNPDATAGGGETLSKRQIEILQWASHGLTYREIGEKLYISERTVRYHMDQARELLGAANRAEAVAMAAQGRLITPV